MSDRHDRLVGFLTEWRCLVGEDTLQNRLTRFLDRATPLMKPLGRGPSRLAPLVAGLRLLVPQLRAALQHARARGISANPWTLAGLRRREVRNAAVLAGLWSPSRMGGAATVFLAEFLSRVVVPAGTMLPDREELARGYRVRSEHCPGRDDADRIDIVVETARHLIGIEVKIDADEGDRQLDRYVAAIAQSASGLDRVPIVMMLAPRRPSRPDVLWASWSTVRAAARATLPRRRRDHGFDHHLLRHFARHVGAF